MNPEPLNLSLRERVLRAVGSPLSQLGVRVLDSFFNLPSIEKWNPKDVYLLELNKVFNIGLPFALLAGNETANAHRQEVGIAIGQNEEISKSLLSEIHAGAILSHWGATVKFVPTQEFPTPDIEANWESMVTLDVEVTRGETRHLHKEVQQQLRKLCDVLLPGDIDWNIICFIGDASCESDLLAMFEAATKLNPGDSAEERYKWCVRAVSLEQKDQVVGKDSTQLYKPDWWPDNEPAYVITSTLVGAKSNPILIFRSLVPLASYRNPILRKANSRQRRYGNPYLIVLDARELPRAHERIIHELYQDFELWTHVSGVMLFDTWFPVGVRWKEYVVSIHANPTADIDLPPQIARLANGKKFSIDFVLSEE